MTSSRNGLLVCAAAVLLLAGCDGARDTPARPSQPPPHPYGQLRTTAPPAWIATANLNSWLALGTFCWDRLCMDGGPIWDDVPLVRLERGQLVRFYLGFVPERVEIAVASWADWKAYRNWGGGDDPPDPFRRSTPDSGAGPEVAWRAKGEDGVLTLSAFTASGDAQFWARVSFE